MNDIVSVTLDDAGTERSFEIVKMDAFKAERWYLRALVLVSGIFADGESLGKGNAESVLKALSLVDYEKAEPLLRELLECCFFVDGNLKKAITPNTAHGLIQSPVTLTKLRIEAFKANFGFLLDGNALSSLLPSRSSKTANK